MTTLTPYRKALLGALEACKATLPPYDPADAESMTVHMTLDLQRGLLLPVADMFDHGVGGSDVDHIVANALSNVLLSHAMSRADGERAVAATVATNVISRTAEMLGMSLNLPGLDDRVVYSDPIGPTGTA